MKEQQKRDPKDRQHETLQLGKPESSLAEKVKQVTYNTTALPAARQALYATTGEAAHLPNLDDLARERREMFKKSKSSKKK